MARQYFSHGVGLIPTPGRAKDVVPSVAATEAAVAVLEADGASPTQAHVNDLRAAWNTLSADVTAVNAAIASAAVVVEFDPAVVLNLNNLKKALDSIYAQVSGTNYLTQA